jgi:hypothetical protein
MPSIEQDTEESNLSDDSVCPYCEEEFEDDFKKGVHISQEHVDTDSDITKSKADHNPDTNIIEEKWSTDGERGERL